MSYSLQISRHSQKELAQLSDEFYSQVKGSILSLAGNPRPHGCAKLKARDGWRIRVGDYRVIYDIDDEQKMVTIVHIGHRRDVYR